MQIDITSEEIIRFWSHVEVREGDVCWPWKGQLSEKGYGRFHVGPRCSRKYRMAHVIAFILTNGDIPEGMFVLHKCDNRPCCRPDHLYSGTNAQNVADRVARGRSNDTAKGCRGERHPRAKLRRYQADQIRDLFNARARGDVGRIARLYGVSPATIYDIGLGRNWRPEGSYGKEAL